MTSEFGAPADDAELAALLDISTVAFLGTPKSERNLADITASEYRVLRRGGAVAAGLHIHTFGQWFGGRAVKTAGIGAVSVAAAHRGGGAGSALMRHTLSDLHSRGFPISVLYPATQPVYRRAGYEQAGNYIGYKLPTQNIDLRERTPGLRTADRDDAMQLYQRRARRGAGNLERTADQWKYVLPTGDPGVHAFSVDDGYVSFTQRRTRDGGEIHCRDLVALSADAARRLLSLFADHRSQVAHVHWHGPPADPVLYVLAEQWHEIRERMLWMLRVVDVRTALSDRGYPAGLDAELHLDVRDDVLPWNDGRFVLEISNGSASVRKGGRGRMRIDVRGLSPLFTGHHSAAELLVSGYVDATDRELATAQRIFAGPAPWMPDFF